MSIADLIAEMILKALEDEGEAEIARNELASKVGCVPSQVSYVVTSRFTPERGYIVESRRGGGGFIRITRIPVKAENLLMHIVNTIGDAIDENSCKAIIKNLLCENILSEQHAKCMIAAVSGNTLKEVAAVNRDRVRAALLKSMLLAAN